MRSVISGEQHVRLEYCVQKLSGFVSALRRGGFGWKTYPCCDMHVSVAARAKLSRVQTALASNTHRVLW